MKVVINLCYGGFSLSREGVLKGREISNDPSWGGPCIVGDEYDPKTPVEFHSGHVNVARTDPILIAVIEEFGHKADGACASLKIIEIPDDINWNIAEYDGLEHIAEDHRTWS